jgi:hypothetical protein
MLFIGDVLSLTSMTLLSLMSVSVGALCGMHVAFCLETTDNRTRDPLDVWYTTL